MGKVGPLAQEGAFHVNFTTGENLTLVAVLVVSLIALLVAYVLVRQVLAADQGGEKMREVGRAIQEGSRAYLTRQFRTLSVFVALLFFLLLVLSADSTSVRIARSVAFLFGAGFSALAGFTGMNLAVRGNVRVAAAANTGGLRKAMPLAFRAGGVAGMFVVGLGLLGATIVVIAYKGQAANVLFGFGFGAALLAMFMRVGGGIFTKAADVGADLVGKVEKSIPEDDPRNAATIADNVGDNVGDCAGMAADLFESFAVTLVAAIVLGVAAFPNKPVVGLLFPLVIQGGGILASIVGIWVVRPRSEEESGMRTINRGFFLAALLSAVLVAVVALTYVKDWRPLAAVVLGIALASVIQLMTSYYTATQYKPVQEIADASETGPATTVLAGFSIGLESSVYALLAIVLAIVGAVLLGATHGLDYQLYLISLIGMGILSVVGVIVSMDSFGPVSDNAQGIAEMSGEVNEHGNQVLTKLDAVGNTTKAITKGMAIATAVIAATSLFGSFRQALLNAGLPANLVDIRAPRAAHAGSAGGAGADRHRLHLQAGGPGRLPGRRDPDRPAPGGDAVKCGRRLGQRQEVRGGRPPRRQEFRGTQGDRDRRHRRRPVQGHRRPGPEPADQGDEPGLGADRADSGDLRRQHRAARGGGSRGCWYPRLGAVALLARWHRHRRGRRRAAGGAADRGLTRVVAGSRPSAPAPAGHPPGGGGPGSRPAPPGRWVPER